MLPSWAQELQLHYESDAVAQFILHGNVDDRYLLPVNGGELGSLTDFLLKVLLPRFDVVITYDVGNGLRVERGGEALKNWPRFQEKPDLPREPRAAVDWLSHFMRWCVNVARLGQRRWQVAVIVRSADLLVPAGAGWAGHELSGLASQVRDWAADAQLSEHSLATILIAPNLNDLHPLVAMNPARRAHQGAAARRRRHDDGADAARHQADAGIWLGIRGAGAGRAGAGRRQPQRGRSTDQSPQP